MTCLSDLSRWFLSMMDIWAYNTTPFHNSPQTLKDCNLLSSVEWGLHCHSPEYRVHCAMPLLKDCAQEGSEKILAAHCEVEAQIGRAHV